MLACRDSAKRSYQRTASTITSGGKLKPTKADYTIGAGRPACLTRSG